MESSDAKPPVPKAKRILAVDDEPNICRLIKINLERHGYEVETAANGVQALAKIRADKPDLIITDVMMPEMNGFELLNAVRSDVNIAELPVLMMLAKIASIPVGENYDAFSMKRFPQTCDCIVKPFSPDQLHATVKDMLSARLPIPQGKRILVVDDVPDIVQIIKTFLKSVECKVETAENGAQALAKIKSNAPDLLITDKNMSEMNGLELIDTIRCETMLKDLPILLMVSPIEDRFLPEVDPHSILRANQVIAKPFCPNELLASLRAMLVMPSTKDNE